MVSAGPGASLEMAEKITAFLSQIDDTGPTCAQSQCRRDNSDSISVIVSSLMPSPLHVEINHTEHTLPLDLVGYTAACTLEFLEPALQLPLGNVIVTIIDCSGPCL